MSNCRAADTYQLTAALLDATGARVQEIVIFALTGTVFYAHVMLTSGATIDARPSDALNLALRLDAPIAETTP